MADTTIVHASTWDAVKLIPSIEQRYNALALLLEYGLNDITPHSDDPFVQMVVTMALPNINAAAMRYDAAVANGAKGAEYGKKGGRPQKVTDEELIELKAKGFTQRQIADQTDIDVKTVQRRLSAISQKGHNPSKPLDIDIDTDIDSDIDIDIDSDIDIDIDSDIDTKKDIYDNTNTNGNTDIDDNTDIDGNTDNDTDTDTRGYAGFCGVGGYEENQSCSAVDTIVEDDRGTVLKAFGIKEKDQNDVLRKFDALILKYGSLADRDKILALWAKSIRRNDREYNGEWLPPLSNERNYRTDGSVFLLYGEKVVEYFFSDDDLPF